MTALLDYDASTAETLRSALGADTVVLPTFDALRRHLDTHLGEDAVVIGASVDIESALALASTMRVNRPSMGVVMVRRRVDTSVLADALRSGVREVVEERDLAGINAAVARVKSLATSLRETVPGASAPGEADEHGRLVTVFSAKGGCGKTTLSTNLAVALTEGGRNRVCLVDLDLSFGDVAIALQLFPAHTIVDAVARRDEDHGQRRLQQLQDLEAVELGHLHIQKEQIRSGVAHRPHCLQSVFAGGHHFNAGELAE